ncbi:MAG TPA: ATP-binding cassette domain-containing protein, partial [Gammaproteobacteria bacterium]|nr:ATP-binding cassette domain-containing protein [Gammaproteobacteria bacterium]
LPVNDPPQTPGGEARINENTQASGRLAATDPEHDPLLYHLTSPPAHGQVNLTENGRFTYRPEHNYSGSDHFAYTVDDGHGGMAPGGFNITIDPTNHTPTQTVSIPDQNVVVTTETGTGKTTLAHLLMGHITPSAGHIDVDGITLQQVSLSWWREQIIYLPRHINLVDGSILENITLGRPDVTQEIVDQAVVNSGLRRFIDQSAQGIHTQVVQAFPASTRKQLAMARALVTDGILVILDEPFEGLDVVGRELMANNIQSFLDAGKSVVLMLQDPNPVGGHHHLLDLNPHSGPRLITDHESVRATATGA